MHLYENCIKQLLKGNISSIYKKSFHCFTWRRKQFASET